jgi:4-hydroxybenzoate polyprenyltransferase
MGRARDYAQLVRLPNVFTAAADSLAGWLVAVGSFADPARWLPLCGASMALYAAGIALNDVFDVETDRVERPGRPVPSGRIPLRAASVLGWGLLVLGLALAGLAGSTRSLATAAALAACIVGYDAGLKRTPIGPLVMGACRGLNLALGLSGAADFGGRPGLLAAGAITVFVAGITCISRSEVRAGERALPLLGGLLQGMGLLGLVAAVLVELDGRTAAVGDAGMLPGLLVLIGVGAVVANATARGVRRAEPKSLQMAVKTGVLSLVWLNVGLVAALRGPLPALAVAALWVPAYILGKWLYST